tara:strand:+ start:826 stop:1608 length:783 start_codon:yes stop_codon:yes gene_type:complete
MANFLSDELEPQLLDGEEFSQVGEEEESSPEQGNLEEEIPQKYQGKSNAELIRMHQEAEKLSGRQGNEVGELRKLVDDYVVNQTVTKPVEEKLTISDVDWIENPDGSVDRKIDNHPAIKKAEEASLRFNRMEVMNRISTAHPDFQEIVADESFQDWIGKSQVRVKKLKQADQFDFDAADDLFTTWKERQELIGQAKAGADIERKNSLKSGSNGGARGSGEGSKKKFFKRSELLHMMQHDPDRYLANSEAITQAYAEGRVR